MESCRRETWGRFQKQMQASNYFLVIVTFDEKSLTIYADRRPKLYTISVMFSMFLQWDSKRTIRWEKHQKKWLPHDKSQAFSAATTQKAFQVLLIRLQGSQVMPEFKLFEYQLCSFSASVQHGRIRWRTLKFKQFLILVVHFSPFTDIENCSLFLEHSAHGFGLFWYTFSVFDFFCCFFTLN